MAGSFVHVGLVEGIPQAGAVNLVLPGKLLKPNFSEGAKTQPPPLKIKNTLLQAQVKAKNKNRGRKSGAYGNYKKAVPKIVSNEIKRFKCTYCDYITVTSTNLLNHTRTHTGEKPFVCEYCPYRSTQKGNLRSHIAKHHWDCEGASNIKIVDVQGMAYPWHSPVQDGES